MNEEAQSRFAHAQLMLAEAKSLTANGQHGAALKLACEASEHAAAAYLSAVTGQSLLPSDATYDLFAKTIREPNRHPAQLTEIRGIVGDVCALREIYEPALLDETTSQDAGQMIERAEALQEIVKVIVSAP